MAEVAVDLVRGYWQHRRYVPPGDLFFRNPRPGPLAVLVSPDEHHVGKDRVDIDRHRLNRLGHLRRRPLGNSQHDRQQSLLIYRISIGRGVGCTWISVVYGVRKW